MQFTERDPPIFICNAFECSSDSISRFILCRQLLTWTRKNTNPIVGHPNESVIRTSNITAKNQFYGTLFGCKHPRTTFSNITIGVNGTILKELYVNVSLLVCICRFQRFDLGDKTLAPTPLDSLFELRNTTLLSAGYCHPCAHRIITCKSVDVLYHVSNTMLQTVSGYRIQSLQIYFNNVSTSRTKPLTLFMPNSSSAEQLIPSCLSEV